MTIVGARFDVGGVIRYTARAPSFYFISNDYYNIAPSLPSLYWMLAWCPADPVNDALFAMRHKLVG